MKFETFLVLAATRFKEWNAVVPCLLTFVDGVHDVPPSLLHFINVRGLNCVCCFGETVVILGRKFQCEQDGFAVGDELGFHFGFERDHFRRRQDRYV